MNVSQPKVAPRIAIGQVLMIDTEKGEQGGVEVMDVHRVFLGIITKLIR